MDKRPTNTGSKAKRNPDLGSVRTLILTAGFALILGLWTLFSKQLNQTYSANSSASPTAGNLPSTQDSSGQTLELPPLPTLIPEVSVSGSTLAPLPKTTSVVPAVPAQAPAKIFLGGAKPQARSLAPAPVTRTRSSRP